MINLIYRKSRPTGNFSIETSFDQFLNYYQKHGKYPIQKVESSYYSKGILERIKAIFEIRKKASEINHITGDVHYLSIGLPKNKTILTIHDCGFMEDTSGIKRMMLKWFWLTLPVRNCRFITTVSEATKRDIIKYTGCSPQKIRVIPTLINPIFSRHIKQFNKNKPRLLHIGLAPNKNFERHVKAISGLNCHLHIIGKLEAAHFDLLEEYSIEFSNEYNLTNEGMQEAYHQSDIILFASTLEGFGMPIIEAQTIGRAVITSNISSMPEVAGKGACFVNPFDVQSIREGIQKVLIDEKFRSEIIENGFENIERFKVEEVSKKYEFLYQKIL